MRLWRESVVLPMYRTSPAETKAYNTLVDEESDSKLNTGAPASRPQLPTLRKPMSESCCSESIYGVPLRPACRSGARGRVVNINALRQRWPPRGLHPRDITSHTRTQAAQGTAATVPRGAWCWSQAGGATSWVIPA